MTNIEKIIKKYKISTGRYDFKDIHWRAQDSHSKSILIYNAPRNTEDEIEKFKKRIEDSQFAICLTNLTVIDDSKVFTLNSTSQLEKITEDLLNEIYPFDSQAKCMLGVTGTNGKTTTVEIIRQLVVMGNLNVLTVGTLGVYLNDKLVEDFSLTSPSYVDLRKVLYNYSADCHVIAMELSSHALEQNRMGSLCFDRIGWTNITQDHLDYHGTMDNYFNSKKKIFNKLKSSGEVVVSRKQEDLKLRLSGIEYLESNPLGRIKNLFFAPAYNRENLEVAVCLLKEYMSISLDMIESLNPPPGRFNIIQTKSGFIIIDYAHTPDGLESICREVKLTFPKHRLVTVFGCGGDRDKLKRPLMGKAASLFSDYVILTSDNPRFENPELVMDDAQAGITGDFERCCDRTLAIEKAIKEHPCSVVLIAGKGHEEYIDVKGTKHNYSDESVVRGAIKDD